MKYISSQHFLDEETVEEKIHQLIESNVESVKIPCTYVGFVDGEEYAIVVDHHHTLAAARALGINAVFVVDDDPEGLTGESVLEARWIDGDYYDVEISNPAEDEFYTVW